MIAALVRKELRELLPFGVLAMVLQCTLVGLTISSRSQLSFADAGVIPFVFTDVLGYTFIVATLLAVALGLWQTMWENGHGTFLFLLHRPLSREALVGTKLLTGGTICLVAALLPVAWYAIWAVTPGTHASPFSWSMTAWAWLWAVQAPLLYLGAFLSGLRPAKLFGSRFAPLACSVVLFGLLMGLSSEAPSAWWPVLLIMTLVVDACFVFAIIHVAATRDYS
jgi:hypothetical protein